MSLSVTQQVLNIFIESVRSDNKGLDYDEEIYILLLPIIFQIKHGRWYELM